MDPQSIQPEINTYLDKVENHIAIKQAILFGSVAKYSAKPESDVDLLILSDDFSNMDFDQRSSLLYRLSVGFPHNLHVYGLTPTELDQASPLTTLGQIKISPTIRLR